MKRLLKMLLWSVLPDRYVRILCGVASVFVYAAGIQSIFWIGNGSAGLSFLLLGQFVSLVRGHGRLREMDYTCWS
jgi:hypothetical protein